MMKFKLIKILALGLCLSTLYTGAAFAAETAGDSAPAYPGLAAPQTDTLLDKQTEIDKYLFADHMGDIEAQGFKVSYTGITDLYVEIGITPYTEANAQYLYDIFGDENVKIVEGDMMTAYSNTGIATDAAVSGEAQTVSANWTDAGMAKDEPVSAYVKTVSTAESAAIAESNILSGAAEKVNHISAPVMILIIACGAALVGGTVLLTLRKETSK